MTSTDSAALPLRLELDTDHVEELEQTPTRIGRIRYACQVQPYASTQDIRDWLYHYGYEAEARDRSRVSTTLNQLRRERGIRDTGEIEAMTDDMLRKLDSDREDESEADNERDGVEPPAPAAVDNATVPASEPVEATAPAVDNTTDSKPQQTPTTRMSQARAWLISRFVWIQYAGLLTAAAYGLFEVLHTAAGAPLPVAIIGAAAIELVGISTKLLADRGEDRRESRTVVRALLVISGAIALGIGAVNAWGHSQMPTTDGESTVIAAALYGMASIAGYSLWTITTTLAHRAKLRDAGQLDGPGLRIPAYVRDRYGADVATRAHRLSRFDTTLSIPEAVDKARRELDDEAQRDRERQRLEALRAGLRAQAYATHTNDLAAELEINRYSPDVLADMLSASSAGHEAKARALTDWMQSYHQQATE